VPAQKSAQQARIEVVSAADAVSDQHGETAPFIEILNTIGVGGPSDREREYEDQAGAAPGWEKAKETTANAGHEAIRKPMLR
jgi:hypothetical protein